MINFHQFVFETIAADMDLKPYMHGRCAIFAIALHLEKGYPLGILWDLNTEGERDYIAIGDVDHDAYRAWEKEHETEWWDDDMSAVAHMYCYKTPTVLVDAFGHTDERKVIRYYSQSGNKIEPHFAEASREEVEKLMKPASPNNVHGGMAAPRDGEIEKLRQYIRSNPAKY